jgi:hypothetical protein
MKLRACSSRCETMRYIALLATLVLVSPALAQQPHWTAAPVPSVGAGDTIMPAARAGAPVTDDGSTPFSSVPTGSVAANGATSANQYNGVDTPNLSK